MEHYRSRGLAVVVTLDAIDGLDRAAEAPELVALGRSISEPAVALLDATGAEAVFQLTFTDLDEQGGWPAGIAPLARLGLVAAAFNPEPE